MNNPLVQPDPGLFIWTILTFLVLLTLLAKFAWGPLLQALDGRQKAIRKSLDDAQQAKQELERLAQESAADHPQGARRGRGDHHAEPRRRRAAARGDCGRRREAEADGIVRNAERQIQLETGARAAADPPRSGRPVGDDRVEDHSAQPLEGRQRAADRRRAHAGRRRKH